VRVSFRFAPDGAELSDFASFWYGADGAPASETWLHAMDPRMSLDPAFRPDAGRRRHAAAGAARDARPGSGQGAAGRFRAAPTCARWRARLIVFGGTPLLTYVGYRQMLAVFDPERISSLQMVLLAFVTVTVAWIGFSALAAVAAWVAAPRRPAEAAPAPLDRVALVMPLYNEDPGPSFAALQAMGEGLVERGAGEPRDLHPVGHPRSRHLGARDRGARPPARGAAGHAGLVSPPQANAGRKAGNLRDFVERWGGRYDAMLVLDADSMMEPGTIVEMGRRMAAEPRLGILQSVPTLAGGRSLFARLQQFAGRSTAR
jgi:membrane glycosyltransferase